MPFSGQHRIGRPLGTLGWLAEAEQRLGRKLSPRKRDPKPRVETRGKPADQLP